MVDKPENEAYERLLRRLKRNVRTLRHAVNLTVEAAAARADVHWRHWQKIEAGEVNATLATITKVASALGVDPQHLLLPRSSPEREKVLRGAVRHAARVDKGRGR